MQTRRIVQLLGSLRLTVVCLACAAIIVLWGTMAQVEIGVYAAQQKFFRSWFITAALPGTGLQLPVFPGGYLVGGITALNIVFALIQRHKTAKQSLGLWLTHGGLLLLLIGQFSTDMFAVESVMRLVEGQPQWYSEDQRHVELAIVETTQPDDNVVTAIPQALLARQSEFAVPELPFRVKVRRFMANSVPVENADASADLITNQGASRQTSFREAPRQYSSDRRDMPTAEIELLGPQGSIGTCVASLWLAKTYALSVSNRTFELALRPVRYYKPFALELTRFKHEKYPGSAIPRNFESEVRIINPEKGENRNVRIRMNNPLRYYGETYYQSGYDERDPRVSILQVVRNPAWITPYISCALICLGLAHRFTSHLITFTKGFRK